MLQQLMQQLQQQQQDPFQRPMPGDSVLPGTLPNPWSGGAPGQYQPQGNLPGGMDSAGMSEQVANSQKLPGLPNFPKQMGGFGFGSMTPKVFNAPSFMNPQAPGTNPFNSNRPQGLPFSAPMGTGSGGQGMQNPFLKQFLAQTLGQGSNIGSIGQF